MIYVWSDLRESAQPPDFFAEAVSVTMDDTGEARTMTVAEWWRECQDFNTAVLVAEAVGQRFGDQAILELIFLDPTRPATGGLLQIAAIVAAGRQPQRLFPLLDGVADKWASRPDRTRFVADRLLRLACILMHVAGERPSRFDNVARVMMDDLTIKWSEMDARLRGLRTGSLAAYTHGLHLMGDSCVVDGLMRDFPLVRWSTDDGERFYGLLVRGITPPPVRPGNV